MTGILAYYSGPSLRKNGELDATGKANSDFEKIPCCHLTPMQDFALYRTRSSSQWLLTTSTPMGSLPSFLYMWGHNRLGCLTSSKKQTNNQLRYIWECWWKKKQPSQACKVREEFPKNVCLSEDLNLNKSQPSEGAGEDGFFPAKERIWCECWEVSRTWFWKNWQMFRMTGVQDGWNWGRMRGRE